MEPICSSELRNGVLQSQYMSPRLSHKNKAAAAAARLLAEPFLKPLSPKVQRLRNQTQQAFSPLSPDLGDVGSLVLHVPSALAMSPLQNEISVPRRVRYERTLKELRKTANGPQDNRQRSFIEPALSQTPEMEQGIERAIGYFGTSGSYDVDAAPGIQDTSQSSFPTMRRTSSCPALALEDVLGQSLDGGHNHNMSLSFLGQDFPDGLADTLNSNSIGTDGEVIRSSGNGERDILCSSENNNTFLDGSHQASLLATEVADLMATDADTASMLRSFGFDNVSFANLMSEPLEDYLAQDLGHESVSTRNDTLQADSLAADSLGRLNNPSLLCTSMDYGYQSVSAIDTLLPCQSRAKVSYEILQSLDRLQEEIDPIEEQCQSVSLASLATVHPQQPPALHPAKTASGLGSLPMCISKRDRAWTCGGLSARHNFPAEYGNVVMGMSNMTFPDYCELPSRGLSRTQPLPNMHP